MKTYSITESRLTELLRAETKLKIQTSSPEDVHYEANLKYWENMLLSEKDLFMPILWNDDIIEIPESTPFIDIQTKSFTKRINRLAPGFSEDPFLEYMLQMDLQDIYGLFGYSIETIEGAERISSLIHHGLYDDGELGVVKDSLGFYVIAEVGDYYDGRNIYEEDLWDLLKTKRLASDYYKANKAIIEDQTAPRRGEVTMKEFRESPKWKASMEYSRLNGVYSDLLFKYMDKALQSEVDAEKAKREARTQDIKKRAAEKRKIAERCTERMSTNRTDIIAHSTGHEL